MKLVIGNQKTYLNRPEVVDFIKKTKEGKCENVIICASFPYIDLYLEESNYIIGAQNVSVKGNGASTGEISAEQLNSLGVSYSIVAHSERRNDNKETSEMFVDKINNLLKYDIRPIFCIGENLDQRESNITKDVVGKQIIEVFDKLSKEDIEKIIVAYEPVWAIGTGKVPTNSDIEDMTNYIKDLIQDKYGSRVLVLYGGSVNQKNIDELNTIEAVDGYLIGGASTKADEFLYIMSKCEN